MRCHLTEEALYDTCSLMVVMASLHLIEAHIAGAWACASTSKFVTSDACAPQNASRVFSDLICRVAYCQTIPAYIWVMFRIFTVRWWNEYPWHVNHKVAHVTHLHARFSVATVCHATLNLHSPLAIWPYCWQHVFQLVNKHEFHQVMSMLEIASSATDDPTDNRQLSKRAMMEIASSFVLRSICCVFKSQRASRICGHTAIATPLSAATATATTTYLFVHRVCVCVQNSTCFTHLRSHSHCHTACAVTATAITTYLFIIEQALFAGRRV